MTVTYILSAVVLLGLCIFVHELGHLLGGKMVGIKAKTFSMGYGRGVLKKKFGDTTYQVTLIPFGGYCQFYGEDPGEERTGQGFEFLSAHPLKRIVTVAMGPLFNLIFGIILFFVMNLVGYTQETNKIYIPEQLKNVSAMSPAYASGLRSGDEITSINDKTIRGFSDIQAAVMFSKGRELDFTVKREGRQLHFDVAPKIMDGSGRYTIGVTPYGTRVVIAGLIPDDIAESAGLQEMDEVISIDGKPITSPAMFTDYIKDRAHKQVIITVMRGDKQDDVTLSPRLNTIVTLKNPLKDNSGSEDIAAFDSRILSKSFNEKKILLNGESYDSSDALMAALSNARGKTVTLKMDDVEFTGLVAIEKRGFIGVYPAMAPEMIRVQYGVAGAFVQALVDPYDFIVMNIKGMGMLFSGKMSVRENISGPIRIAKIAGDVAYYKGVAAFIILMAKISIILMVMNLLPIPAVDGSHLVFYFVEFIRGKPLSEQLMARIQTVGIILLIILGAFIIVNDISQLPIIQRLIN